MAAKILSDVVTLPKSQCVDNCVIEEYLTNNYGEIIRWAIVFCDESSCKISVSYKK